MPNHIFISHAEEDAGRAHAVVRALEERGARCWIASRDIAAGANWGGAISQAIATSRLMILFLSRHANESQHVLREVERAVSRRVPIIPLRLERVELSPDLEFYLGAPQWLDAVGLSDDELLAPLTRSIRSLAPGLLGPDTAKPGQRPGEDARTARQGHRSRSRSIITVGMLAGGLALYGIAKALDGRDNGRPVMPVVTQPNSVVVMDDTVDRSRSANPQRGIVPARDRPQILRIGSSIGTSGSNAALVGAFVADEQGTRYLITTADVLRGGATIGTPVLQLSSMDGRHRPDERIGTVVRFFEYTDMKEFTARVVLVRLDDWVRMDPTIPGIGRISGIRSVDGSLRGVPVRTVGRRGRLAAGIIVDFDLAPDGHVELAGGIYATLSIESGDSGALVVDNENRAIGLVIGDADGRAVLAPLRPAMAGLGVTRILVSVTNE